MKTCKKCGQSKELTEFPASKNVKSGYLNHCYACENERQRLKYEANRDKITQRNRDRYHNNEEHRQKTLDRQAEKRKQPGFNAEKWAKYKAKHEAEINARAAAYREANRETIARLHKEWRDSNKTTVARYSRKYREKNLEAVRAKSRAYHAANRDTILPRQYAQRKRNSDYYNLYTKNWRKTKYHTDPVFRLSCLCRARTRIALDNVKNEATFELLGCSPKQAWDHLLTTCDTLPENYDVDHVIPVSLFDLTDESHRLAAFNWRNLQILSAHDNRSKNDNWDGNASEEYISWVKNTFPDVYAYLQGVARMLKERP
jgi:hypothetical protein